MFRVQLGFFCGPIRLGCQTAQLRSPDRKNEPHSKNVTLNIEHSAKLSEFDMKTNFDKSLHWTDQFVENGFAVAKGLVDPEFCNEAVERIKVLVGDPRPLDQWTTEKPGVFHEKFADKTDPVLDKVYEQRAFMDAIATMHGGHEHWNGRKRYFFFVKPYDPEAKAQFGDEGHIDFGNQHVPIFFRGFALFVLLADTEPFSGNTIVWPGTHRDIQKQLMADPGRIFQR